MKCELMFYCKNGEWFCDNFVRQLEPSISEQKHRINELMKQGIMEEFINIIVDYIENEIINKEHNQFSAKIAVIETILDEDNKMGDIKIKIVG